MDNSYKPLKCPCWHTAHCGTSCTESGCECRDCECPLCRSKLAESLPGPDQYPVYPEDDGYDTPKNPYSQV